MKSYLTGYLISIFLTLGAYFSVVGKLFSGNMLTAVILIFAIFQLVVQLVFFLHLRNEKNPRWNLILFLSTASIILIIVVASLWIMANLNYNMTPQDMEEVLILKEGIHK